MRLLSRREARPVAPAPGGRTPAYPTTAHPDWCGQGHRCGLGEHRSDPLRVDVDNAGSLVVTRVSGVDGHEYAEVRGSLRLTPNEAHARTQLAGLVDGLAQLMFRSRRAG